MGRRVCTSVHSCSPRRGLAGTLAAELTGSRRDEEGEVEVIEAQHVAASDCLANEVPWECSDVPSPVSPLARLESRCSGGVRTASHLASCRTTAIHPAPVLPTSDSVLRVQARSALRTSTKLTTAHTTTTMFRTALQTVRPQARAFSASALRAAGSVNYNDVKPLTKQPTDVSILEPKPEGSRKVKAEAPSRPAGPVRSGWRRMACAGVLGIGWRCKRRRSYLISWAVGPIARRAELRLRPWRRSEASHGGGIASCSCADNVS